MSTPPKLYEIILESGFKDVCYDPTKFNAVTELWADMSFCNPPYKVKKPFVLKAIESFHHGSNVLLYLPLDPTTSWFSLLYINQPVIMVFMKRMGRAKFPTMLVYLNRRREGKTVFLYDEKDVKNFIP